SESASDGQTPSTKPRRRRITRKWLWDSTPGPIRRCLGPGLEILNPSLLLGRDFRRQKVFAERVQRWSAEQVSAYQLQQLRVLLSCAYEKSAYYRRAFDEHGFAPQAMKSLGDMRRVPLTDRRLVRQQLEGMCTTSLDSPDVEMVSTGGTSGEPFRFIHPVGRSAVEYAYLVTSWERAGYQLGMPMGVLRGRVVEPDRNGFYHEHDPVLRHHYYGNFHMSDENMARYLEHIATIGSCFLHVYPSSVAMLARFCLRAGIEPPGNIRGIIAESEIVYPEQRKMVEEVFRCRYFSCYGHTEKLVLASECEHSHDYHVWPTYGYFELLDDAGRPVRTPGQRGEIVGTGFINTVMPFIRYRTGDWATYVGDRCDACGREHVLVRDIRGHRTQEVLVTADGSEISWTALNMHDDTFMRVRQFQFVQETRGRAVLHVVPGAGYSDEDACRIQRNLGRKLDGQLTFTIESVEAIMTTAGGKAIYVDQRIPGVQVRDEATETP
ncbi:MAG: phenylacetate--CoA ligase family protein, partial [Phycisphaerales bacterium]